MSDDPLSPPRRYRFDGFEFRERTGELWRNGEGLRLPDQAGLVLLALLKARGELVTHDEMRELLWPGRISGDFEGGLHTAVRKLRRALADDGSEPRLIGTLPRRGYRLLVPVEAAEDQPRPEAPRLRPARRGIWAAAGALLALVLAVWAAWWPRSRGTRSLELPGGVKLELAYLPPGEFAMGLDTGYKSTEAVHRVKLTRGFWMGRTEVTQAQWRAVMGTDPAHFQGDDKPVEQVSWEDCQAFLTRLNQLVPSLVCRLPTEAEWEYGARAANLVGRYEQPDAVAWHSLDSLGQTHPVGQKQPNPWGLYDMVGNVWEWCSDGFGPYLPYPQVDPQGPDSELRTARGGSWLAPGSAKAASSKMADRVTLRYGFPPDHTASDLGFRIVAVPRTR
jgi:formylglycine-generating enzyme required for sulfatase activity